MRILTEGGAYDLSSEPRTGGRYDPPVWGTVLTQVKTLTRVFEGREAPLLRDSNTFLT